MIQKELALLTTLSQIASYIGGGVESVSIVHGGGRIRHGPDAPIAEFPSAHKFSEMFSSYMRGCAPPDARVDETSVVRKLDCDDHVLVLVPMTTYNFDVMIVVFNYNEKTTIQVNN